MTLTRTTTVLAALALVACSGGKKDDSTPTSPTTGSTATGTGTPTTGTATGVTTSTPCDITEVPPVTGDALTESLAGECPLDNRWGSFVVSTFDGFSIVDGKIADGVVPITILEDVTPAGALPSCQLLRRNNPFCDPACQPDETCDFDGSCIPFPENQHIGKVTVGGLQKDVLMSPIQPGNNYFDTQLPHPAFNPGDLIELNTGCGEYDPIELHGVGVEPLVLTTTEWVIEDGVDMAFEWAPPTVPVNPGQHIHVRLNIDQHGNTPVQMFCEFPDTGSAALPALLVDELMNFGVTGFPNATVTRRTVDSGLLDTGGCVQFVVSSPTDPSVLVDGYIPCIPGGSTCPTGMTCNGVTGLCE